MQEKAKYGMNLSIAHLLYINTSKDFSLKDYYPFGMVMPERSFSYENYQFGFNGKENDNEVKGQGNSIDFGARIYDPRLGRFLSVDPFTKKFPCYSPYNFAINNPIGNIDYDGNFAVEVHYKIAYDAAIKVGYSKEVADKIAYMSSTYADHPEPNILGMKMMGLTINGGEHLKYGRFGVSYGKGLTAQSQSDDPVHAAWHSMRSTLDVKSGMTAAEAKERGMTYGWDRVLEAGITGDLGTFGQGMHALHDADAHEGASMDEHLGKDEDGDYTWGAKKMLINDLIGNTDDAEQWSNTALTVFGLLQKNNNVVKSATNKDGFIELNLKGVSNKNQAKILTTLNKAGYNNIKKK